MRSLCIALLGCWLLGCGSAATAPCSDTQPCTPPLVCSATSQDGVMLCMRGCDVLPDGGIPRICSDGLACVGAAGAGVCHVGGPRALATSCAGVAPFSCEPGTLCSADVAVCEQVCDLGAARSPCRLDEICTDVEGGLCRRPEGGKCDEVHPCATGLACTPSEAVGLGFCTLAP